MEIDWDKPIQTKDGRPAGLCYDKDGNQLESAGGTRIVWFKSRQGNIRTVCADANGYVSYESVEFVNVPERVKCRVYLHRLGDGRVMARNCRCSGYELLAVVDIDTPEGTGL